jgi:osmoprotectant transport system permease protein
MTAEIVRTTGEHLLIVALSVGVAIILGIPIGVWCTRSRALERIALRLIDAIQTIPSLALFGFLIPVPFIGGIGMRTAIVALILYSLLPIVRNTFLGIRGVDPLVAEAGVALGMTPRQLLRQVELPLAAPSIVAGIRIATTVAIGLATIAAAIGGGGLGTFIFRGVAMVDTRLILAGALPAAGLALVADLVFGWVERALVRS